MSAVHKQTPTLKAVMDLTRTYLSEPVTIRPDGRPSWADELGMALCEMVSGLHLSDLESGDLGSSDDLDGLTCDAATRAGEVWALLLEADLVCGDGECLEYGDHTPRDEHWCADHCPDCQQEEAFR